MKLQYKAMEFDNTIRLISARKANANEREQYCEANP